MSASHKGFDAGGKRRTDFEERTASAAIVEVTTDHLSGHIIFHLF